MINILEKKDLKKSKKTSGKKTVKSVSILKKRLLRFKKIKRGYYSLIIIGVLYALSFFNPIMVNNKALVVNYNDQLHFPAFGQFYDQEYFGQNDYGEADYRQLKKDLSGDTPGWVIMPFYSYSPTEHLLQELLDDNKFAPSAPCAKHWLGTDNQGRDVFARLAYGFNISITFAVIVTFFSYLIGITIGAIIGYCGGKVDIIGQRFIEIFAGIPFLYSIMLLGSFMKDIFGDRSMFILAFFLIILGGWISITYYIRGEFLREKSRDYVAAAIAIGASGKQIMFKHILPNAITPIITFAPFAIVGYIFALVSLDFLGFGLLPPTPSWGELLDQGRDDITRWWLVASPLVAMFFTLLSISFIGEALREAFDPKVHSRLR